MLLIFEVTISLDIIIQHGHFLYISTAIFPLNFHSRHVTTVVTRPHTVDFVDSTGDRQSTGDRKSKSTLSLVCTRP